VVIVALVTHRVQSGVGVEANTRGRCGTMQFPERQDLEREWSADGQQREGLQALVVELSSIDIDTDD